jgi:acetyltransferase-like isoleucine patch superfamily enzyme/dTDP-4-dehydrorhamnose 3,5-epimerase-like enzyme
MRVIFRRIMTRGFFAHPNAIVEPGAKIGKGTRIWAFTHILPGAQVGEDCNICDGVFIENEVTIGDRVTIKCGVQIWDGIQIEDDVFVGPNATFTNDPFPRSNQHPAKYPQTIIRKWASIGANATILPGLEIGKNAMVGAGSVVTRDIPSNAIVAGNPARIIGYVDSDNKKQLARNSDQFETEILQTNVPGVILYKLPGVTDIRGDLTFGEYDEHLPFIPKRFFTIFNVPTTEVRGEHMHKTLHEFLVCLKGSVNVVCDNGQVKDEIILDDSRKGLHIPPSIWTVQYKYSPDAILLVLASDIYDGDDYIRSYDEFLAYIGK